MTKLVRNDDGYGTQIDSCGVVGRRRSERGERNLKVNAVYGAVFPQ